MRRAGVNLRSVKDMARQAAMLPAMTTSALSVIRQEHAALAAMLRSLPLLLEQGRRRKELPDFALLRAMLFYIDEFPERLHHRKEDEWLFPLIRARCPEVATTLDQLERDHAHGERAIRDLEPALLAFAANRDPLTGHEPEEEFRPLFSRIVNRAPAPIGLG